MGATSNTLQRLERDLKRSCRRAESSDKVVDQRVVRSRNDRNRGKTKKKNELKSTGL